MPKSREIHLKSRPQGKPVAENFELVEIDVPDPGADEVLVENIYMSVDPYMRGRMAEQWPLGEVMIGGAIGKVVASNNSNFAVGDYVNNGASWREYFISNGQDISKVDPELAPWCDGYAWSYRLWWPACDWRTERRGNRVCFCRVRCRRFCCGTNRKNQRLHSDW